MSAKGEREPHGGPRRELPGSGRGRVAVDNSAAAALSKLLRGTGILLTGTEADGDPGHLGHEVTPAERVVAEVDRADEAGMNERHPGAAAFGREQPSSVPTQSIACLTQHPGGAARWPGD